MSPIILNNEVIGAVEVFRDVTNEREIDKAKSEFVSLASHQLRTPLSTINWYAEILLEGDAGTLTEDQKKYLQEIYTGNQRMVALVNALLNVSRIELGTFTVQPTDTDMKKLIQDVASEQEPQIKERNINFSCKLSDTIPHMQVDAELMWMVFQNLLSNAIKYTPPGGSVTFSMSTKDPGDKLDGKAIKEKSLCVSVEDTGYGIPESQKDKIFTKLFRADNVKEKDAEGTGLGLYIVRSIVEHSGGEIWFESKQDEGTTFYVLLPMTGMKERKGTKALV